MSTQEGTASVPKKASVADEMDDILAPASKKGHQETDDRLEIYTPRDFEIEKARRSSTNSSDINYLYCIVFQEKEQRPSGFVADLKANCFEPKIVTQGELEKNRHKICRQIEEAGFVTQTVYNALKDKVLVKIGCNDERLLREAELKEYKLECNEESLKHILELRIKDINPDAVVDKPKHRVFLDFLNYTKEDFEKIQSLGGEGTLPIFRERDWLHGSTLTTDPISLDTARKTFLAQCKWSPFKNIHMKYDSDWETKIIEEHNVQLYKTYLDGTILRTVDRIDLIEGALAREPAKRQGIRGAGLDLKNLQFKKHIVGHFPIQYSSQIRKAQDLSPKLIFERFKMETPCCTSRLFLPFQQPIQDIRDYCGEKIAYYFAFLEFYSLWLTFSAVLGLIIFFAQLGRLSAQTGEADIVSKPAVVLNISLAPLIDSLNLANGSELTLDQIEQFFRDEEEFSTPRTKFALSVDRDFILYLLTPTEIPFLIALYSVIIAFWAAFFLEFWKRRQATLAFKWGVSDYEKEAEVRPEFVSRYDVPDAVTGLPTPYRSVLGFGLRLTASFSLVGTLVAMTVAAFAATYVFKAFMSQNDTLDPTVAVQSALVLNAVAIFVLGTVFKTVGKKLTDWENHRTDVEYEDQLIGKTFIFCFFNSYTTLIYFAFLKSGTTLIGQNQYCVADLEDFEKPDDGDDIENPDQQVYLSEELFKIDSCYGALGYSLIIIFATQIFLNNFQEIGIPMLSQFVKKWFYQKAFNKTKDFGKKMGQGVQGFGQNIAAGEVGAAFRGEHKAEDPDDAAVTAKESLRLKSPAETQFLMPPYETPFSDYLELALQFGYVTLFVAAFPLAPFLALLNNFIEVWVDASKICLMSRRPNVQRAQDIGTWLKVFEVLSYVAIITNAAVLCFTSVELVPLSTENEDESKVWAFLAFIVAVFGVKYITDFFISDTPDNVIVMRRRQEYIENKIFFDTEDDTEKMIVSVDKYKKDKKEKAEEEEEEEDMEGFKRFHPLTQDPYMNEIVEEVKEKMKVKGISQDDLFNTIDINNSEMISLVELKRALLREDIGLGHTVEEAIVTMFVQALDIDGDGHISKTELTQFLEDVTAPQEAV